MYNTFKFTNVQARVKCCDVNRRVYILNVSDVKKSPEGLSRCWGIVIVNSM